MGMGERVLWGQVIGEGQGRSLEGSGIGLDWGFTARQQYLSHFETPREVGKIQCDTGVCHLVLLHALR
jgi:hypothetical protein